MKNIPVLTVTENSLAAGYEKALVALYEHGTRFKTQYDKPGDPLSLTGVHPADILGWAGYPLSRARIWGCCAPIR